jgi:hypothetical protein
MEAVAMAATAVLFILLLVFTILNFKSAVIISTTDCKLFEGESSVLAVATCETLLWTRRFCTAVTMSQAICVCWRLG